MTTMFRAMVAVAGTALVLAMSYGLALLGHPETVWLFSLLGWMP